MIFKKNEIKKALEFYNINDKEYLKKCLLCIDYLEENKTFLNTASDIYKTLYSNKLESVRKIWKKKKTEDLFKCKINNYITNILILCGYKKHKNSIKKYRFDENLEDTIKRRVRECLLSGASSGMSLSKMLWAARIIKGKILEVGRLQYELVEYNPLNITQRKRCIKIHIPSGSKLHKELILKSLKEAKKQIKKYYKLKNIEMFCDSWLLSKELSTALPNSNIAYFASLFDLLIEEDAKEDLLHYVFKLEKIEDLNLLSEETTLEKVIKQMWINNIVIHKSIGILKEKVI